MARQGAKATIDAIYETELEQFLLQAGLHADFHAGHQQCAVCGRVITVNNLFGFTVKQDSVVALCISGSCVESALSAAERSGTGQQ